MLVQRHITDASPHFPLECISLSIKSDQRPNGVGALSWLHALRIAKTNC
jgi:hypothetical protein